MVTASDLKFGPDGLPEGWPHHHGIESLGYGVLEWAEKYLAQPDRETAGSGWRWRESQARFVAWWYALNEQGEFLFRRGQIVLPKGPLAHDTPVLTPQGWRAHGTLVPGDEVYAGDGSTTRVVVRHDDVLEDCYRVTLRSGESFVATGSHRWRVREFTGGERVERTLTTQQMVDRGVKYPRPLTTGKTKAVNPDVARFRVLPSPGFGGETTDLPLDPYVFGYWLGDGDSDCARLTVHEDDLDSIVAALDRANIGHLEWRRKPGSRAGRMTIQCSPALRGMGVLNGKHIPDAYLRAGRSQRLALLGGLIDSDGHVGRRGRVEISQKNRHLAGQIRDLAVGLGLPASLSESDAVLNGRVVGKRYRVTFGGIEGLCLLPRKAERLKGRREASEGFSTVIDSIEPVESVWANCIMVEHPSHTYLVGRGLVPSLNSGKSPLAAALACCEFGGPVVFSHFAEDGRAVGKPHPSPIVQLAAVSFEQTSNVSRLVKNMLEDGTAGKVIPDMKPMDLTTRSRRGELMRIATSARSGEGVRATASFADEALPLDTPIPTPDGWTTMGEVKVGDTIFGRHGEPVRVGKVTEPMTDRRCYQVTFTDGSSLVASEGHKWWVRSHGSRCERFVTTADLVAGKSQVPLSGAARYPTRSLPADPYLVGLWLGDGSTGQCYITGGYDDLEFYASDLTSRGIYARVDRVKDTVGRLALSHRGGARCVDAPASAKALRALPCFFDKHIPDEYLRGDVSQREALLQGLVDSDGHVDKNGRVTIVCNTALRSGIVELLRSLGIRCSSTWCPDERSRAGGSWKVHFVARNGVNPARLPRKAERVKHSSREWVGVASVVEVEGVPVRCVGVDAEHHTFLAGRDYVVTGNTHHWIPSNGGREFFQMMRRNLAKTGGRMLELTNCWSPGEESVAEATFRAAEGLVELSGPAQSEARRTLRWQPHVHVEDLRDLDALKKAMDTLYADFPWIDTDNLLSEALAGTTASEIRRFYLNEIVSSDTALVLDGDWTECQVSSDDWRPLAPGETVTLGFDGGKTDDATALIACRAEDRTFHVLGIWEKPRDMGHRGRFDWEVDREAVDQRVRHAIDTYDVVGFYSDVALWETYVDAWSALVQNSVLVKAGPRSAVGLDMRGNLKRLTEGTNRLVEAIEDHAIGHDGDERLRRHVLNAQRRPNSWGTSFGKSSRESPDKVDALSAMLLADMARYDYMQSGAAQRRRGGKLIVLQ